MKHDIVKRGVRDFYCRACRQQWTTESKASCPGLSVVDLGGDHGLLTKNQLAQHGYSVAAGRLPRPVACYRRWRPSGADDYVRLYDPAQAVRGRATKRVRSTFLLETLAWPRVLGGLLEEYQRLDRIRENYGNDRETRSRAAMLLLPLIAEICNVAVSVCHFSADEAAGLTEAGAVVLTLQPAMTVHRQYRVQASFVEDDHGSEQQRLAGRVAEAWRKATYVPPPPPTPEELAERTARRTAELAAGRWIFPERGVPRWVSTPEGGQRRQAQLWEGGGEG